MIGYLKGKILSLTSDTVLILTDSGVGFEALISGSAFSSLSGKEEGEIYTYMHVKEDGVSLYGFSTVAEKEMFLKLTSVSGVGPKMGIAILTGLSITDIASAIASKDSKRLSAIKGLGKKTAERLILELREKIAYSEIPSDGSKSSPVVVQVNSGDEDAVVALVSLGFSRSESEKAIIRAREQGAETVEDIIMVALKGM